MTRRLFSRFLAILLCFTLVLIQIPGVVFAEESSAPDEPAVSLELELEPEPDPELEPELGPELEPELDPELEPELGPELEPELDPELEPELDPELEPELDENGNPIDAVSLTKLELALLSTPIGNEHFTFMPDSGILTIHDSDGFDEWKAAAFLEADIPGSLLHVVVAAGITAIPGGADSGAFDSCLLLESVTFEAPELITSIGMRAFENCVSLDTLDFSALTALEEICQHAFSGTAFTDLDLSDNIALVDIKDSAFESCAALTSVIFPYSLKTIYNDAFIYCQELSNISFPLGSGGEEPLITSISENSFFKLPADDGTSHAPITLDLSNATSLERIDGSAFQNFYALETLDLSGCTSLTAISTEAFRDCSNLTTVKLPPNVYSSGSYSGMDTIGDGAFSGCSSLLEMELPYSIQSISASSFAGCNSITAFSFIGEPDTDSGHGALDGNTFTNGAYTIFKGSLYTRNASGHLTLLCAVPDPDDGTTVTFPAGTRYIGERAFSGQPITSVILPASVEVIAPYAFENCSALESVLFEGADDGTSQLWGIGYNAFSGCASLTELALPDSVLVVDEGFVADSGLTHLTIPSHLRQASIVQSTEALGIEFGAKLFAAFYEEGVMTDIQFHSLTDLIEITVNQVVQIETNSVLPGIAFDSSSPFSYFSYLFDIDGVLYACTDGLSFNAGRSIPPTYALLQYPAAKSDLTEYDIEETMRDFALYSANNATPNSDDGYKILSPAFNVNQFKAIGEYAFYNCGANFLSSSAGLQKLYVPTSTQVLMPYAFGATIGSTIRLIDFADPGNAVLSTLGTASFPVVFERGASPHRLPLALFLPPSIGYAQLNAPLGGVFYFDDALFPGDATDPSQADAFEAWFTMRCRAEFFLSVYRGSAANTWAVEQGIPVYYRARGSVMEANPPKDLYQYVPYRFTPVTDIVDNSGLTFEISAGSLPVGLRMVVGDEAPEDVPSGMTPGTIYGALWDSGPLEPSYSFTLTATSGGMSTTVPFTIYLEGTAPDSSAISNNFDYLGHPTIDVDGGGTLAETPTFFFATDPSALGVINRTDFQFSVGDPRLSFHINKRYNLFRGVWLNGRELVRGVDYVAERGSTKVTLNANTMNALPDGDYTIAVAFQRTDFEGSDTQTLNDLEVLVSSFTIEETGVPLSSGLPGTAIGEVNDDGGGGTPPDDGSDGSTPPDNGSGGGTSSGGSSGGGTSSGDSSGYGGSGSSGGSGGEASTIPAPLPLPIEPVVLPREPDAPIGTLSFAAPVTPDSPAAFISRSRTGTGAVTGLPVDADGNLLFSLDGSGAPMVIRVDEPIETYRELFFDGVLFTDCSIYEGSTILHFTAQTLETVDEGRHVLRVVFAEKVIEIPFILTKLALPVPTPEKVAAPLSASASIMSAPSPIFIICIGVAVAIAGIGLGLTASHRRKRGS